MKRRHLGFLGMTALLLVMALSLLAAGCGGSADTTTTAASTEDTTATSTVGSDTTMAPGESGSIVVSGLVDTPMTFTSMDSDYMNWTTVTADHPKLGSQEFEGVLLSEIFSYVGVQDDATAVTITASDGTIVDIALTDITSDAMMTVDENGAMSAIMPGMDSQYWVEDIVAMEFR
jgi:hypothetical protein